MELTLRLFGGLEVTAGDGQPIDVSAKKARALLAYLATPPRRRHAREHVASILWGDISADEHARRSLRQTLTVLRKGLPSGVLDSGRQDLGLTATHVDVADFLAALAAGDRDALRHAVALYRGDFLEGFSARADGFDEWAASERTRLRALAVAAMERLCRLERDAGQLEAAVTLAMRVVALEPLRESAHRELMQLHVAADAPGGALRQYEACRKLLARELGIAPSQATSALAARIRAADAGAAPRAPHAEVGASHGAAHADLAANEALPGPRALHPRAPSLRQVVVVHAATTWERAEHGPQAREGTRSTLTRFGGHLLRDAADALSAVYGAASTRGSALEQAVRAALAVRDLLTERGLPVRIGVASGQALVDEGEEGLLVQGDVVSVAACLHEVGSLVISGAVRSDLGERAEVLERGRVRGSAAWELLDVSPEHAARSVLLGRDFELSQLSASLSPCVATGRGRSYLVRGEPGIGKTLLVAHFCQEAQRAGFEVRRHHVLDFGCGADSELLHSLTRGLLLPSPDDDVDAALGAALSRGDLTTSDLAFARRMLHAGGTPPNEIDTGAEETARQSGAIVGKLLTAQSRRTPQLVWIEDIHWAPVSTRRELAHLIATVAECRALLVMTTRIVGEPDDADWRRAVRGRAVSTLDLAPLGEPAARALLEWLARLRGADVGDTAQVIARAGGNPLFLEQLCRADAATSVPGSVQALVQSRVDALDTESRRVLEAASVLGQQVEEAALLRVTGTTTLDLSALVEHGLLRAGGDETAFTHALVRDAVYASLTDARRRALHLEAAAHYAERNTLLRAAHLERAHDSGAPGGYWHAADEQRRGGGMEHALELCDRGLALATHDADLYRLGLLRGELLRELGRPEEALAAFDAARRVGAAAQEQAQAWLGTAAVHRLLDRQSDALEALAAAARVLDETTMPELCSHVHFMRGNVLFPSGDADACLEEHERALALGRRARSPLAEAQALSGMADAHYVAGRMRSATQLFERCEALAEREGLGHLRRSSRGMRLVIQVLFLRVREAAQRCSEEADRAEEVGALRAVAFLRTGACLALGYLGDWERMEHQAQSVADLTRRMGARRFEALGRAYLAVARFHLGREHEAEAAHALELSIVSGSAFSSGVVHAALVACATAPEDIRREIRRGLAALDAGAVAHSRIVFLTHALMAAIRMRDAEDTRRLADLLLRATEEPSELLTLLAEMGQSAASVLAEPNDATRRGQLTRLQEQAHVAGLTPMAQLVAAL